MTQPRWYQDAIIYEVHIRSFFDSDGDGIGDLRGLTRRLDYIKGLGVTALWLLPFYPSPLLDDGYDIAAYTEVHPDYGTLGDFQTLLREAHRRGLRVITELVINHTSDQHHWFQRARRAPRGSVERDFYVWSDHPDGYPEARVLFPEVKATNWSYDPVAGQYYWHRFYAHQPDLNFHNPRVRREILEIVDFWLEMGIDGLRLDAVTYLYEREGTDCENLPETHAFLRELRAHVDAHFDEPMLLAEANLWPEEAIDYFGDGDECHMVFHFPLMPRLFMALEMEDRHPIVDILDQTPALPAGCQWALFLRNHDELTLEMVTDEERDFMYRTFAPELRMRINLGIRRRLAPLLRGDQRKIRLLYALLFSLPGTPIIYYGDEIGMGDNYHLGDRDGVRTPMQWSPDRNAGFSRANSQSLFLPVVTDPAYHYLATNVEIQEDNPSSLLQWLKRLIALRRRLATLGRGSLEVVPCTNHRILAFLRRRFQPDGDDLLVVINLSRAAQPMTLDLSECAGTWPVEQWGQVQFPPIDPDNAHHYPLALGPYDFYWFRLHRQRVPHQRPVDVPATAPPLQVAQHWTELFAGRQRLALAGHLAHFLDRQSWFNPRRRALDGLEAHERARLRREGGLTILSLVEARYVDGDSELYLLPLECSLDSGDGEPLPRQTRAWITELEVDGGDPAVLFDATANPAFASALLAFLRRGWKLDAVEGSFQGHWSEDHLDLDPHDLEALAAQVETMHHSHTTLIFGRHLVMKLVRRLERGTSIDVEMSRFLLEQGFSGLAPLVGHLDYHRGRWEPTTVVTVHEYIPHENDGLTWYCGAIAEGLRSADPALNDASPPAPVAPALDTAALLHRPPPAIQHVSTEAMLDATRRLGQRTAALHVALACAPDNPTFAPMPLTQAYERARYQSMRTLCAQTFRLMRHRLDHLPHCYDLARWLLEHQAEILERFHALVGRGVGGLRLRIHGDYHLKEVLIADDDFVIIDFEGHPWLPIGERRIKRSPLRDLASMLCSMHHAALGTWRRHCEIHQVAPHGPRMTALFHHAQAHFASTAAALLEGYLEHHRQMPFLPPEPDALAILTDALRLKKSLQKIHHDLQCHDDPCVALMVLTSLVID